MHRATGILTFAAVAAFTASEALAQTDAQTASSEAGSIAASIALPVEAPAEGGLCDTLPYSMQLRVLGVRESRGTITVDVHDDDPAKFLKSGGKLARLRVPAAQGETLFCIAVPKAGIYALAIYHDRNANTKLDKNFIGLPSEPFGLSNNPPLRLAMPKHRDSAFEINGPRTPVMINLGK